MWQNDRVRNDLKDVICPCKLKSSVFKMSGSTQEEKEAEEGDTIVVVAPRSSRININYFKQIFDQISLEGLDGITFQALRLRLGYHGDQVQTDQFLFDVVKNCPEIQIFQLDQDRGKLVIYDRSGFRSILSFLSFSQIFMSLRQVGFSQNFVFYSQTLFI